MAGSPWSKTVPVFLVVAAGMFCMATARPAGRSVRKLQMDWLEFELNLMDLAVNTARKSYYKTRISPAQPVVFWNLTRQVDLDGNETAEDILRSFIQEIDRFRNPVFLAYFDENARANKNPALSQKLYSATSSLNGTYSCAVSVLKTLFPSSVRPSQNTAWTRESMENEIKSQQNPSVKASIQEVRSYVTLRDLQDTQTELGKLLKQLQNIV